MPEIIHSECLEWLRERESNSITTVVTDPPYGLKFMSKKWDYDIPSVELWQELLRVVKPGGMMLCFGGSRTYHRLTCRIEDAGWEIRDCIIWLYGSGFPKSHNHFGFEGYGTALKPAYEPIIMAMKPLDGTFKQNAEKWGIGGINIDACRIKGDNPSIERRKHAAPKQSIGETGWITPARPDSYNDPKPGEILGRWPANIILDEEAGAMLDQQSGILKSGSGDKHTKNKADNIYKDGLKPVSGLMQYKAESGGASRFFYCAKASTSERNAGLDGFPDKIGGGLCSTVSGDTRTGQITIQKNNHPTVKPLKLMEYLIKLVMPPKDGLILDPFMGSGSTILAAKNLGYSAIGLEREADYCDLARGRLAAA